MADTQESVAGQKTSANVDQSGGLLSSLMGETSVTQRWVVSWATLSHKRTNIIVLTNRE